MFACELLHFNNYLYNEFEFIFVWWLKIVHYFKSLILNICALSEKYGMEIIGLMNVCQFLYNPELLFLK